jgi:hypothetical protein
MLGVQAEPGLGDKHICAHHALTDDDRHHALTDAEPNNL